MFLTLDSRTFEVEGAGSSAPPAAAAPGDGAKPADAPADTAAASLLYPDKTASESDGKPPADKTATEAGKDAAAKDGEGKKDEEGKGEEDKAKAEQAKLDAEVPEDGKYEFKMPEGVELDSGLAERAAPILKEAGITRGQANKLAELIASERKAEADQMGERWAKVQEGWQAEAKADKEIGGDKFDASIVAANKALAKLGTPELQEYLQSSGGGNHPELIRFVARVGNLISDDKPIGTGAPAAADKTVAQVLYPNN